MSDAGSKERDNQTKHGLTGWIGGLWCRLFHRRVMLPIHGYYQCRRCFRRIPISFEVGDGNERR